MALVSATLEVGSGTFGISQWRLTSRQMVSTSREPVASLDLWYVLVYRCSHIQDVGLTSCLYYPRILYLTFRGYTTKAYSLIAVYSCVIKYTHTDLCSATDCCHQALLAVQNYVSNKEHLRINVDVSLSGDTRLFPSSKGKLIHYLFFFVSMFILR